MPSPDDNRDASASETVAALEAEIVDFSRQQAECADRVKALIFAENPAEGVVHAKEIFTLQQEKLRLEVEVRARRNKINRIRAFGL